MQLGDSVCDDINVYDDVDDNSIFNKYITNIFPLFFTWTGYFNGLLIQSLREITSQSCLSTFIASWRHTCICTRQVKDSTPEGESITVQYRPTSNSIKVSIHSTHPSFKWVHSTHPIDPCTDNVTICWHVRFLMEVRLGRQIWSSIEKRTCKQTVASSVHGSVQYEFPFRLISNVLPTPLLSPKRYHSYRPSFTTLVFKSS